VDQVLEEKEEKEEKGVDLISPSHLIYKENSHLNHTQRNLMNQNEKD
jgi:hypothetical protein